MGFLGPGGMGQVGEGCLGWSAIVYMSSRMFRGKESSNRIELSGLVQDLLNFGILGSLRLWGWGVGCMGVAGGWGVPPTHAHMHVHGHTHMHTHAHVVNMIISCKWPPPLGESLGIPYDVIHACVCVHVHVCACVWGAPSHHPPPTSTHPPTPRGGHPQNQSKFNSTWTNQDISILFEDLKSVETSPSMGGCMVWWVGGWVDGWVRSKH